MGAVVGQAMQKAISGQAFAGVAIPGVGTGG
jgi:hypothetical protein